jgi:hypothetical protein
MAARTKTGSQHRPLAVTGEPGPAARALRARNDPYLLRNVIWCHGCDQPMHPSRTPRQSDRERHRTYKCSLGCRKHYLLAAEIESRVITATNQRAAVDRIARVFLQSALELLIVQVRVGPFAEDLEIRWRT